MSFYCPSCTKYTLEIINCIELPADSRSDEIRVQTIECKACPVIGAAIYEESRRGSLDNDSWEHSAYQMELVPFQWLKNLIKSCPQPHDYNCDCSAHQILSATDERGRWQSPDQLGKYFRMKR